MIDTFGVQTQSWHLMEEMGEVMQALSHFRRKRCGNEKVIEELIDLQIVISSLKLYYINDEEWAKRMVIAEQKLEKLLADNGE